MFFMLIVGSFGSRRENRLLNIFSLVRFANEGCQSRNETGTCFTAAECGEIGGESRGSCALGFGVCCILTVEGCGSVIRRNCTYVQNRGYPDPRTESGECRFRIQRCESDICSIRFDFERLETIGPDFMGDGDCANDQVRFSTGSMSTSSPVLCGTLTGQHIYVDVSRTSVDAAVIDHDFSGSGSRFFRYKVSQIPCGKSYTPPSGCDMFHMGVAGTIKSYNFDGDYHLNEQCYTICMRQEQGYCSIQYTTNARFKLTGTATARRGASGDRFCRRDYLFIPQGRNSDTDGALDGCRGPTTSKNKDRFCGSTLTCINSSTRPKTIVSEAAAAPFKVKLFTDDMDTDLPNENVGFCLDYRQLPCS